MSSGREVSNAPTFGFAPDFLAKMAKPSRAIVLRFTISKPGGEIHQELRHRELRTSHKRGLPMSMITAIFAWFCAIALLAAIPSCGSDKGNSSDNSGVGGGISIGNGGGDGLGVLQCTTTSDCQEGQVCHPDAGVCVTPGAQCSSSDDCPQGYGCDATTGSCLPGVTGSECENDSNCQPPAICTGGICGCSALSQEPELTGGALDIYFIFDRTASMGNDCSYRAGRQPPVNSKACYATYALSDYLINVSPSVDTRLAFQFMSLGNNDCNGAPYATPLVDLTALPIPANDPLIQAISDETFAGGFGTHIEGALRGMAQYTSTHGTPGREMIGVLMTDGDPNGCEENIDTLAGIVSNHLNNDGIRTFIIGMQGATDSNLETLAQAGGAEAHDDFCGSLAPPCHYWSVGDGSGDAIASALQAIVGQAAPLPCSYDVASLTPPSGQSIDYGKVNVTLTDPSGTTIIGRVPDAQSCPTDQLAWSYDNPSAPTSIELCPNACAVASAATEGTRLSVVVGCQATVDIPLL